MWPGPAAWSVGIPGPALHRRGTPDAFYETQKPTPCHCSRPTHDHPREHGSNRGMCLHRVKMPDTSTSARADPATSDRCHSCAPATTAPLGVSPNPARADPSRMGLRPGPGLDLSQRCPRLRSTGGMTLKPRPSGARSSCPCRVQETAEFDGWLR